MVFRVLIYTSIYSHTYSLQSASSLSADARDMLRATCTDTSPCRSNTRVAKFYMCVWLSLFLWHALVLVDSSACHFPEPLMIPARCRPVMIHSTRIKIAKRITFAVRFNEYYNEKARVDIWVCRFFFRTFHYRCFHPRFNEASTRFFFNCMSINRLYRHKRVEYSHWSVPSRHIRWNKQFAVSSILHGVWIPGSTGKVH